MLSVEEMKEVLTRPKNALCKQYKQLFTASHTDFKTTPDALQEVAVAACKRNSGARGLRSILELLLQDALYEVRPSLFPPELKKVLQLRCSSGFDWSQIQQTEATNIFFSLS